MFSEQERLQNILRGVHDGDRVGQRMAYSKHDKTIRPTTGHEDPDDIIEITREDLGVYSN